MIILAIETSCDDTCVAILEIKKRKKPSVKILSNIVSSQVKIHRKWGGVYPTLAKREHQRNLPLVLNRALRKAGFVKHKSQILNPKPRRIPTSRDLRGRQIPKSKSQIPKIDVIAVTVGPGLEPCLWMGINFAKELAQKLNLPVVPVNHIEAHLLANWLLPIGKNPKSQIPNPKQIPNIKAQNSKLFPAVCLVVSGGHTQLILMKDFGKYRILGETRDDAAGECFDKVAKILGLGYPGGPIVAKMATKSKIKNGKLKITLPRPMIYQKNYDFSFSGLKTAVLYKNQKLNIENQKYKRAMCKEVQQAIIDVLIKKTLKAAKDFKAKSIILGGGVASNEELRKQFKFKIENLKLKISFLVPPKNFCTDNAAMIAATAYFNRFKTTKDWKKIEADANLIIEEKI